jgi:hypothetical protein
MSPLFKLIICKKVVFDEVYILFYFNITLNTTGCPLLKLSGSSGLGKNRGDFAFKLARSGCYKLKSDILSPLKRYRSDNMNVFSLCVCVYIYIHTHIYMYMYIYTVYIYTNTRECVMEFN